MGDVVSGQQTCASMKQRHLAVALALLAAVLITCPVGADDVYDSRGDQYEDAVTMKEDYEITDKKDSPPINTEHEVAKAHLDTIKHPTDFAAEDTWTQSVDPWLKNQAKQSGPIK